MQEVCAKAGDLFACAYYGPGDSLWSYDNEPRIVLRRRTLARANALRAMCAFASPLQLHAL